MQKGPRGPIHRRTRRNPNDEQQEEGREQQISREEQQDGRDLVHLRIYELEAIKKARKLHTNLKTRRNAVQNMLKEPYGIPAPLQRTMGIQN